MDQRAKELSYIYIAINRMLIKDSKRELTPHHEVGTGEMSKTGCANFATIGTIRSIAVYRSTEIQDTVILAISTMTYETR